MQAMNLHAEEAEALKEDVRQAQDDDFVAQEDRSGEDADGDIYVIKLNCLIWLAISNFPGDV